MAIFPHLQHEKTVQVGDLTRFSAGKSIGVNSEEISELSLQLEQPDGEWFDVTESKYLDWAFDTPGLKPVKLRIVGDDVASYMNVTVRVLTEAEDNLFSTDEDLETLEPYVMSYLRDGRRTYKDVHRESQSQILEAIYQRGIRDSSGERLEAASVVDLREVNEWSKYLTLALIYRGIVNASNEVFEEKSNSYFSFATQASNRAFLKLDLNKDGVASESESISISSIKVTRR